MTQVSDAYLEYVEKRRQKAPPPDPTATLELDEIELHTLVMTFAELKSFVYPKHLISAEEAQEVWSGLGRKLAALRVRIPEEEEPS